MTWKEVSLTPDNVIRCPVCGNIAYFKIDDGVKIEKVAIELHGKRVELMDIPKPKSLLCPWCLADIPLE